MDEMVNEESYVDLQFAAYPLLKPTSHHCIERQKGRWRCCEKEKLTIIIQLHNY